ncbi:MAG TPA: amidohydrolase family protein [Kribbella sp.]|nr:amidohydrolase family protein [Amycolatopsis sp.]HWD77608.1 amidohydrolase family protein [Kribbella sp.]
MTVTRESLRFVDSHVHHWDPANLDWFPHLAPEFDVSALGVEGAEGMKRRYNQPEYLADATRWGLDKYVHVSATSGPKKYLDETAFLAGLGGPLAGLVGTVDLDGDPSQVVAELAGQAEQPLFKGIRNMHIPDWDAPAFHAVLDELQSRGLVYDLVVHPDTMDRAVALLSRYPDLAVVVEHAGWPHTTGDEERGAWRTGMRKLAELGPRLSCKLSGVAMFTHTTDLAAVRPWCDELIELFGSERVLVGSNFPVDGVFGSFDSMMAAYLEIIGAHGDAAVGAAFAANAERIYGI